MILDASQAWHGLNLPGLWWRIKSTPSNPWQDLQKSLTDTAVQAASGVEIGRFLLTT